MNTDRHGAGLPIVVKNSSRKETSETPRPHHSEDPAITQGEHEVGGRAPYRSFTPGVPAPPPSQPQLLFHAGGGQRQGAAEGRPVFALPERMRGYGGERAVAGGQDVEGFCVDEGDVGSWVGREGEGESEERAVMDGGTEERKGGFASPPRLCRKELV